MIFNGSLLKDNNTDRIASEKVSKYVLKWFSWFSWIDEFLRENERYFIEKNAMSSM